MGVVIEDTDLGFNKIQSNIHLLGQLSVDVGPAIESENSKIAVYAAANEFGANIENGFGKGIPIRIPERSFMRSTFDNKAVIDKVINRFKTFFGRMIDGGTNPVDVLGGASDVLVAEIKAKITSNIQPPNAPSTIKRKGSGKGTLFDTGSLLRSITRKVFKK